MELQRTVNTNTEKDHMIQGNYFLGGAREKSSETNCVFQETDIEQVSGCMNRRKIIELDENTALNIFFTKSSDPSQPDTYFATDSHGLSVYVALPKLQ